jgi:hypothetical protein
LEAELPLGLIYYQAQTVIKFEMLQLAEQDGTTKSKPSKCVPGVTLHEKMGDSCEFSFMIHHSILQATSLGVGQDYPFSSMLDKASSPSIPTRHPGAIAYKQIYWHQTTLACHYQRTTNPLLTGWRELQMPYPLHCISRPYL